MTYKFDDQSNDKVIQSIFSIISIAAVLSIFTFDGSINYIIAFLASAFSFYCTRSIYRKNKNRIKELFITDGTIKLSYVYKSKDPLIFKKTDYDTTINEGQITLTKKGEHVMLGIANKDDMDEPEKWTDLIADLTF
jgi:hypothetical protein